MIGRKAISLDKFDCCRCVSLADVELLQHEIGLVHMHGDVTATRVKSKNLLQIVCPKSAVREDESAMDERSQFAVYSFG
jgi:hypothetical protein